MLSLCLIAILCTSLDGGGNARPIEQVRQDFWRNPRRCGINCLYAYLTIHGSPTPIEVLIKTVPIGERGSNLKDLKDASRIGRFESSVVKATPRSIETLSLPAIAHLNSREGHFLLVLRVDNDNITVADMTTGEVETKPLGSFARDWSGYMLVPKPHQDVWSESVRVGAPIIVGTALALWTFPTFKRRFLSVRGAA